MKERSDNLKEGELIEQRKLIWEMNKQQILNLSVLEGVQAVKNQVNYAFVLVEGVEKAKFDSVGIKVFDLGEGILRITVTDNVEALEALDVIINSN